MNLPDQSQRDRFTGETGRNFSVIAPAGVGKTTAIAARILQLARNDERRWAAGEAPRLPQLVVVTYTRKAADEMRDRARQALVQARVQAAALGWFNQAFFGTIHSFCLELLRRFGPLAGLSGRFSVEQEDTAWWLAFQRDTPDVAAFLPEPARVAWRRFGEAETVWMLAKSWPMDSPLPPAPEICPKIATESLKNFKPKRKHAGADANLQRDLERLRRWELAAHTGERALGVPEIARGHSDFKEAWNAAFQPLRVWLAKAAAHAAAGVAAEYGKFKETSGRLGYDDFVRLAARLLRDPVLGERIRAEEFFVLLDEAQDTDPRQFAVLVGVAQPMGAPGLWTEGAGAPPGPGRFSMVGDPQQSIYDRADLARYVALHQQLVKAGAVEELTFSVTLRCDENVVRSVNAVFPPLLDARPGQAQFVPLTARPGAGAGKVWRLPVARPADFSDKAKVAEWTRAEATALAQWLKTAGPTGAGVTDWAQVAVLAPRREWLAVLAAALRKAGLQTQLHAGDRGRSTDAARVWLAALLKVLGDPEDSFEVAGVLREIFGISDDALFHACRFNGNEPKHGPGHPLAILQAPAAKMTGPVADALALLHRLQRTAPRQPLRDAVALVVEATHLRARLAALPEAISPGAREAALDALLNQAALADARGETLADFARTLQRTPEEAGDPVAQPGAVQLLTCHKAKGLDWPVVMLFGMFREPGFPSPEYPRWMPPAKIGEAPWCLLDKADAAAAIAGGNSWKQAEEDAQQAQFERLLYVACTRPKRRLILVDGSALGTDKTSLATHLGILPGGTAQAWWESLPTAVMEPEPPGSRKKPKAEVEMVPPEKWSNAEAPLTKESLAAGMTRAKTFTHRVRPSSLAKHGEGPGQVPERTEPDWFAPPDYPEEQLPPAGAVNYGNWWHGVMETTPWTKGLAAWQVHWELQLIGAPDPERAKGEVVRLAASSLAAMLAAPGLEFATELPFLWAEPGGAQAFDGCVDLAVWDAGAGRWLVVDWKTDRVKNDAAVELRTRYGAQLAVYARTLAAVYGVPSKAYLYSTRTGQLIPIDAD